MLHKLLWPLILPILLAGQATIAQKHHAVTAPEWDALFDRSTGWTGADGIFSIPISGREYKIEGTAERTIFVFSDTFIGEVDDNDNRLEGTTMINNTGAIMVGFDPIPSKTRFYYPIDTAGKPRSLVIPNTSHSEPDQWYWFGDGIVIDDILHVFAYRMKPGDGGVFNFATAGVTIISMDLAHPLSPPVQTEMPLFVEANDVHGEIIFGGAIMPNTITSGAPDPDGYIYVYATQNDPFIKKMNAARVEPEQFLNPNAWQFWDGNEWTNDINTVAQITGRISSEFSVTAMPDGQYILVFQKDALGHDVAIKLGDSPVGPFGDVISIYTCPEPVMDPDIFVYNAKAHPHLSDPDELLISYNVNTFDFWDHFKHADIYRPRFIKLILDK